MVDRPSGWGVSAGVGKRPQRAVVGQKSGLRTFLCRYAVGEAGEMDLVHEG